METETLTILISDITGYTAKTSSSSREENLKMIRLHQELMAPVIEDHGGKIVKGLGDAFLVTFKSPTNAVISGMEMVKTALKYRSDNPESGFTIKVAINTGEVVIEENDIYGDAVNIAARVESLTKNNQVLFTESTYLSMNRNEVPSTKVGERTLKGIPEPIKIFRVVWEDDPGVFDQSLAPEPDSIKKETVCGEPIEQTRITNCPNREGWYQMFSLYRTPSRWPLPSTILGVIGVLCFISNMNSSIGRAVYMLSIFFVWALYWMTPYYLFNTKRVVKPMVGLIVLCFFGALKLPGISQEKAIISASQSGLSINSGMKIKIDGKDGIQLSTPDGSSEFNIGEGGIKLKMGNQKIMELKTQDDSEKKPKETEKEESAKKEENKEENQEKSDNKAEDPKDKPSSEKK